MYSPLRNHLVSSKLTTEDAFVINSILNLIGNDFIYRRQTISENLIYLAFPIVENLNNNYSASKYSKKNIKDSKKLFFNTSSLFESHLNFSPLFQERYGKSYKVLKQQKWKRTKKW